MTEQRFQLLLAVFGTILTAANVVAALAQYRAADIQAQAAIATLQPQIDIRRNVFFDNDEMHEDTIILTSDGGPVSNVDAELLTYFEAKWKDGPVLRTPMSYFLVTALPPGRVTKGELREWRGNTNRRRFVKFQQDGFRVAGFTISAPVHLIRLAYVDALGRASIEYYRVKESEVIQMDQATGAMEWTWLSELKVREPEVHLFDLDKPELIQKWYQRYNQRLSAGELAK